MTLTDAISTRISIRRYLPAALDEAQCKQLNKTIDQCNRRSGLHMRLAAGDGAPFASLASSYGMLTGVKNYIMLSGPAGLSDLEEKCGYFGEFVVLTASMMGLGTCWVGGTYDANACSPIPEGDRLVCVIAVGYIPDERSSREKIIRRVARREVKSVAELGSGLSHAPSWFMSALTAVQRAPSARNKQPYRFVKKRDNTVQAHCTEQHDFSMVDMGIAKLHFEIGAHGGTWTWGNGGTFCKARQEKSCGAVVWRGTAEDHQYLLIQHKAGHWSFPKGHMEHLETEKDTAIREIREETGLDTVIDTGFRQVVTYYPMPSVIKDVVFFMATPTGGTEHAQEEELSDLGWFSFEESRPRVTFATDEDVLLAAEAYIRAQK